MIYPFMCLKILFSQTFAVCFFNFFSIIEKYNAKGKPDNINLRCCTLERSFSEISVASTQ